VAAISFFETAKRRPSLGNLIKLADALSVSVDFLLGRDVARASSATDELFQDIEKLQQKEREMIQGMVKLLLEKHQKQ
jgi:transcriptional regulator with XRE-family HTH domain